MERITIECGYISSDQQYKRQQKGNLKAFVRALALAKNDKNKYRRVLYSTINNSNLISRHGHANQNQFNEEELNTFYETAYQELSLEDFKINEDEESSYPISQEFPNELYTSREIVLLEEKKNLQELNFLNYQLNFTVNP